MMELKREDDVPGDQTVWTLSITRHDMSKAKYIYDELEVRDALILQQQREPTIDGALMILQMDVRAIERGRNRCSDQPGGLLR